MMFERFMKCIVSLFIRCVFNDTLHQSDIYPTYIRHISGVHPRVYPVYIRHPIRSTSSVEFYLRSDLTADYRTSLVPAMSHFYFLFITFHYIPYYDVREIYEMHCVFIHTVCL